MLPPAKNGDAESSDRFYRCFCFLWLETRLQPRPFSTVIACCVEVVDVRGEMGESRFSGRNRTTVNTVSLLRLVPVTAGSVAVRKGAQVGDRIARADVGDVHIALRSRFVDDKICFLTFW